MAITVPGTHVPGDTGHTTDHNLIRQALLDLDSQTVKVQRTPATGRWLLTSADGGSLEVGDTGWRDVRSMLAPVFAAGAVHARLRREGSRVVFSYRGTMTTPTGARELIITLPPGWIPAGSGAFGVVWLGGGNQGFVDNVVATDRLQVVSAAAFENGQNCGFEITFMCDDVWPQTQIGTQGAAPRSGARVVEP
jgi:hypothetical protein